MAIGDFFSDDDMAELRGVASSAMAGSAIIRRIMGTSNGMGGYSRGGDYGGMVSNTAGLR